MIRLMIDGGRLLTPHEANGISMLLEQLPDPAGPSLAAKLNDTFHAGSAPSALEHEIDMSDEETRALFTAIKGLPGEKISDNLVALQESLSRFAGG